MNSSRDTVGAQLARFLRGDPATRRLEIRCAAVKGSREEDIIGSLHFLVVDQRYVVNFLPGDDLDGDIHRALISAVVLLKPPPVKVDLPGAEWLDANERSVGEKLANSLIEDGHPGAASFIRDCVARAARHAGEVKNG